jgi:starch phosphorylase
MFPEYHIQPITNGAHHITWTSGPMAELYDEHIAGWRKDPLLLSHAGSIPTTELVVARGKSRAILRDIVQSMNGIELHEDRLTIGFARRFATYKRADLVFNDLERLRQIGTGRIQFVFAGKAHPKDEGGKTLIRNIHAAAKKLDNDIPVVFLEDYSMATGLAMTSGVDVWMNNPVRPMEASGTSGMKAVMNGVPNCSILDGWWPEGCQHGVNGWAVGNSDDERDDERDNRDLLDSLENEVLPAWDSGDERWGGFCRASISTSARFTAARMLDEYVRIYRSFSSS